MVLLAGRLLSTDDLDHVTLQLKWYHQFQFAGYYMAKEKGFYEAAGLDVEIREVDLSRDVVASVLSQEAQYATGETSLIVDRSQGKKVVVLAAILQASPIVIVTKARPDIQTVKDLHGKHFDVSGTLRDSVAIRSLLQTQNITLNQRRHRHEASDVDMLIKGHADAIIVYNTNETYQLDKRGVSYRLFHPKEYGFGFYSDLLFTSQDEVERHPQRAAAFKEASLRGWEYAFRHIDETIGVILAKYNTQGKTREELAYEAQALKKLAYYKTEKVGALCRKNMQKIYDAYEKMGVVKNSVDLDKLMLKEASNEQVLFTKEEREYLQKKGEITVCGQRLWRPYLDFTGIQPEGLIVDLVKEYENMTGVPFVFVRTENWADCIARTRAHEVDIAVPILTRPNHHKHLTPTKSVAKDHLVLVSTVEKPFLSDIANTGNLKVAIYKGSDSTSAYIRSNYPDMELVYVNDLQEGLKSVAEGRTDAYLGSLLSTTHEISRHYPKELKIIGQFIELELLGSFGVRKDEPVLTAVLNKTIDALEPEKKREIINSWTTVAHEQPLDYGPFKTIMGAAFLLFLIFLYRQYILKKENRKLQEAYARIHKQQVKLKEQKSVYELIFNSTTDGVLLLENSVFADCNPAILKMMHYTTKEELCNFSPSAISPEHQPDGRLSSEKAEEMMALAYEKGVHRFEWVHTKATGEPFWVEVTLTPIVIDNRELLHVVWRDISERKKLEDTNDALQTQLELALSGSRDGLWDWDIEKDEIYFSPRWKEMLGYSDDALKNDFNTWIERVHPDDKERVDRAVKLTLEGKTDIYEAKYRLRHQDGHWIWVYDRGKALYDDNGKAVRLTGTDTDISTEVNLAAKLSEFNDSLESKIEEAIGGLKKAQEQAKLGSWRLDIENDKLLWSDETYNIFELPNTADMATYENFLKAIHPDDREAVNAAYLKSLDTREPYEIIHRLLMDDGRIKYVKEHCETSFAEDGTPLFSTGTIQDITAEHTAHEALRHRDEMMFRQSRLAQMGEMISMIAHQWRQPLNAISMTTATMTHKVAEGKYDKAFFESRLKRISDYVQHLSNTIEDFRNFFKPDKEKQETSFSEIVENALGFLQIGLENNSITVQKECDCKGRMTTYTNELLQVVLNLIKNAEDVLVENQTTDPFIAIRCYDDKETSVLEIEDNAGGIDEAIVDKIFDPYFTTKEKHNGTGLGLYMSKVIIEEHCGGTLSVSNSTKGARFKIIMDKQR